MRKPSLTKKVAQGLFAIASYIDLQIQNGDESDFIETMDEQELEELEAANDYIAKLAQWKESQDET